MEEPKCYNDLIGLFQLKDGNYLLSEELSDKLSYIVSVRPEIPKARNGHDVYTQDESGMAQLFSECYKKDTLYCTEAKTWYTYKDGAWRKDIGSCLVSTKIKEFYGLMRYYCAEIDDYDVSKRYMTFIAKMGDRRFRDRMMKDAADSMSVSASLFDSHPYLINCKNGTFDLKTRHFKEHDYKDYLTMQTNFDFTYDQDMDVTCERWLHFIDEVTEGDKDKADFLQRALGYSMLGSAREECMFILHGKTTRNGKSTMLDAVNHLLGDYSTQAPVELICKADRAKSTENASPVLARLKGKRMVTMSENDAGSKLDEEIIKQYTGGEEITARELYQMPITFLPQFTMWLSCNDLPAVHDRSLFASKRLKVIEFNRHFSEAEQDKTLKDYFRTPEAMMGIFYWLLEGYARYTKVGLVMADHLKSVVKKYEKDNDLVVQFLEDRCELKEDGTTSAKSLYDNYKIWCTQNGYFKCSAKKFNAAIREHVEWYHGEHTTNGRNCYDQIAIKPL